MADIGQWINCLLYCCIPVRDDIVIENWAKNYSFHAEHTHAKMASHKRETIEIEQRIYVLFVFEVDDKCKIIKTNIGDQRNVFLVGWI